MPISDRTPSDGHALVSTDTQGVRDSIDIIKPGRDQGNLQDGLIVKAGAARHSDVIKAARQAKNLIPSKYMSPRISPLTREVKSETNRFDFELED